MYNRVVYGVFNPTLVRNGQYAKRFSGMKTTNYSITIISARFVWIMAHKMFYAANTSQARVIHRIEIQSDRTSNVIIILTSRD